MVLTRFLLVALSARASGAAPSSVLVVGEDANDLVKLLTRDDAGGGAWSSWLPHVRRASNASAALAMARPGDAVLLLGDASGARRTPVPASLEERAKAGGFRAYVEFPEDGARASALSWKQRAVVTSGNLSSVGLDALRILQLQDPIGVDWCAGETCGAKNATAVCKKACDGSLVSFAQIAGVDTAAFGVTDDERTPLLVATSSDVIVSATTLSGFVTGRAAPQDAFRALWAFLLDADELPPPWTAPVRPTYDAAAVVPASAAADAVDRSARWISTASTRAAQKGGLQCHVSALGVG